MSELILSTMHRTKGLEFDTVILAPSEVPLRPESLEEEKRLRYVAITRARKRLIVLNGPRECALLSGMAWQPSVTDIRAIRFDSIDQAGAGAFQLFGFSHVQDYIMRHVREADPLYIMKSRLYHSGQRLCGISAGRRDLHQETPLGGIVVSEVTRWDSFGEEDKYKDLCSAKAQAQGWYYVVNAAGHLRPM